MDLTFQKIEQQLLSYKQSFLDFPFGENVSVYKVRLEGQDPKMFALLVDQNDILRLSLKCDPILAQTLRAKYESVLPGYHLPKKYWNTIVLSGQLSWSEIMDLINHSYQLVAE